MRTRPSPTSRPAPLPGLLHTYADRLVAFEYSSSSSAGRPKPHTILFIPGLGDGLVTVTYLNEVAAALENTRWSIFTPVLSSSYGGWGMSAIGRDIDEMALCVEYIMDYKRNTTSHSASSGVENEGEGEGEGKIVIMGCSTGSQDVLTYISCANPRLPHPVLDHGKHGGPVYRPQVDGAILHSPVSDRQTILSIVAAGNKHHSPEELQNVYDSAVTGAKRHTYDEHGTLDTIVPIPYTTTIGWSSNTVLSSRRFLSLASPDSPAAPAEDDLFSSDLPDERLRKTFGMVKTRGVLRRSSNGSGNFLVLLGGRDPSVPKFVDKEALLGRWRGAVDRERRYWHCESGIIPGATHMLEGNGQAEQRRILVHKVMVFLSDIETNT
ncbi:uncharacterized protein BDV14DRAFT_129590 [Aspergillus stella-maris]|uniref:uncharacterized protein n=1 Tax=Aspergillus stella-maris TaxID=1810926 RepID=UPI003CCC9355